MYLYILEPYGFEYRNYINGHNELMRKENIVSISEAKRVSRKTRKSYGLTKEKAARISLKTRDAYLAKYPATSEA